MSHPLKQELQGVRRRARLVLLAYAVAWLLVVILAAGLALAMFDWALRSDDMVVRLLFCGLWWFGLAAAVWRFVYPAIAVRLSDVELAHHVQRRWPELGDRLSSAVEFIDQSEDDVLAGSPDLRRTVIADAAARVERFELNSVVNSRRPLPVVVVAAGLAAVVLAAFLIIPSSASLATRRLMLPLSGESWPRKHQLAFIDPPRRIAAGEDFHVELKDQNGSLPDEVEILFRLQDGGAADERQAMEYDYARNLMVYRLNKVTQPFEYRAVGGDDDTMSWIRLDVVQPPRVESLRITLVPPEYTGWPPETSDRNIRALAGTRVGVQGKATKSLSGVSVMIETAEAQAELTARVGEDGKTFVIPADAKQPWRVEESGVWGLRLTDSGQFQQAGRSRWELRAIADRAPTISLERPGANTYVTADAVVPLKALVKDDLLVKWIKLVFQRSVSSEEAPAEEVLLYEGPAQAPPSQTSPLAAGGTPGDSLAVDYQWDLSRLEGIQPGETIDLHLSAADYLPQENACTLRRLTVISTDELTERIAQRQTFILGQLAEALAAQQDARSQTKALAIQLEEVGRFDQQDINHLQSAELNQRRVETLLVDDREGLTVQIEDLLAEVVSNRLDSPDISRRMEDLLGEIRRIGRDELPVIQQQLVLSIKVLQAGSRRGEDGRADEVKPRLAAAGEQQDRVIESLEQLRKQLAKWDSYRRFAREVSQLRRDQAALAGDTAQRRLDTLGRDFQELEASERATFRQLAERQNELARRLERILGRMDEMQLQLAETDPLAAETISDAVHLARQRAIAEQMRMSGRDIETNRLGQAAQAHAAIDEALEEMLDLLAGRRAHELERVIRKLQGEADQLDAALEATKGLAKKLRDTEEATRGAAADERTRQLERLTAEQRGLQEQVERLARQLQRLQAQRAGESTSQAAQKLGGACQAGQKGDAKSALDQTRNAQQDLEQATDELKQRLNQLEQDLLQEQFARIEQHVVAFREQQQAMLEETQRLRRLEVEQERLTRAQAESVRDLAKQQRALADEARGLGESLGEARVFRAALDGAADEMNRSAARLARRLIADTTQQIQQNTIRRLDDLLAAMQPEPPADGEEGQGPGGPGSPGGPGGVATLAELKLLKMLQEHVLRRTIEIQEARQRRGGDLTDEMEVELADLAQEQGRIARLLLELSEPVDDAPEDAPENLPDIREEDPLDLDQELEKTLPQTVPQQ